MRIYLLRPNSREPFAEGTASSNGAVITNA